MNKSAKKIFYELGFTKVVNNKSVIAYRHILNFFEIDNICFHKKEKEIEFNLSHNEYIVNMKYIQAINKQIEELGWNND